MYAEDTTSAPDRDRESLGSVTHDRETQAKLKLAARSYRKALAKHAARPSATRAAKVAARQAELTVRLERSRDVEGIAA